jgi:hypothetical protein
MQKNNDNDHLDVRNTGSGGVITVGESESADSEADQGEAE